MPFLVTSSAAMCMCIVRMCYVCIRVLYSGFLDDEFTMDPIADTHFNGSQDNGPLSGDHWETELMGAKTTSGAYCLYDAVFIKPICMIYQYVYMRVCVCVCVCVCVVCVCVCVCCVCVCVHAHT